MGAERRSVDFTSTSSAFRFTPLVGEGESSLGGVPRPAVSGVRDRLRLEASLRRRVASVDFDTDASA